ncbi:MAG: DNA repair protein RadC [Alphaproteobacteria bacterium]|jgi:DNA repair protein RadC|nr:DNA repair protein RadC [Alphaproteobacteria bacterium]
MVTKSSRSPENEPTYLGHRARLRERFAQAQGLGLADYELLELLLFLALPRSDTKPLAKALLQKFGSLAALLKAEKGLILETPGVGEGVLHVIQLMQAVIGKVLQQEMMNKPVLASCQSVLDYCQATMAHDKRETVRLLFLDRKNQVIGDEVQQTGTVDHAPLYPREVVKRALDLGASALIIVHNHPSGDPTPSRADIDMTLKVQQAASSLGIEVHDHLIIGKGRHSSLKSMGLM